jgi:predicted RNase H-like HicB family nuclease
MEMIVTETESGRWLAVARDRTDIVASGETSEEAAENLKEMYVTVLEHENEQQKEIDKFKRSVGNYGEGT